MLLRLRTALLCLSVFARQYAIEAQLIDLVANFFGEDQSEAGSSKVVKPVERRLQAPVQITNELPNTTRLTVQSKGGSVISCDEFTPGCAISAGTAAYAGLPVETLLVGIAPDFFDLVSNAKRLAVVSSAVDKAMAQSGSCLYAGQYRQKSAALGNSLGPISSSALGTTAWSTEFGMGVSYQTINRLVIGAQDQVTFRMGGSYRICYSWKGTFNEVTESGSTVKDADIVPVNLVVNGYYDDSTECSYANPDACLTTKRHQCYLLKEQYNNMHNNYSIPTNCVIDFDRTGAGLYGNLGKASWSARYAYTYDAADMIIGSTRYSCGDSIAFPDSITLCDGDQAPCTNGGSPYFLPDASRSNKRLNVPPARNTLKGADYQAVQMGACYCPAYSNGTGTPCSNDNEFMQQVGILNFWLTRVCPHGAGGEDCDPDFAGVTPQVRFSIKVECPGDACTQTGESRLKIVKQTASNDLPSWDPNNGCATAVHGINSNGREVFPSATNLNVNEITGGPKEKFKLWNSKNYTGVFPVPSVQEQRAESGFMFDAGDSDHELRNAHAGETFDICFCDNNCDTTPRNWFKTGQLRFAPIRLVRATDDTTNQAGLSFIQYMNQPGIVGFSRPPVDYHVMGLQTGGALKLIRDLNLDVTDAQCRSASYDVNLVDPNDGPYLTDAATKYSGEQTPDGTKLVFNNGSLQNNITVKLAGPIAICYCARPHPETAGACIDDWWFVAARMTIRGPAPSQSWTFSTHVVFRLNYTGWGLSGKDTVRIIPSTSSCSDNMNNPIGSFVTTSIKVQCPHPCSEIGQPQDILNGDLTVSVYGSSTYECDDQNENCRNNDIKEVISYSNHTILNFESVHFLADGDLVNLDNNIICDPSDVSCTDDMLAALKGKFTFAGSSPLVPDSYIAGHKITVVDTKTVSIPIGWPGTPPRWVVQYKNSRRGGWTRHSSAITKQEVVGTKERSNMKVCWNYDYGGQANQNTTYVAEVGSLTLLDSNRMADCYISLTTTVKDERAPFIVSFKTASAQTGMRYKTVTGTTRLVIFFTRTLSLDIDFVDDSKVENNAGEDEISEARQYICGKLFKELWSSDSDHGFPMPKGCYHRSYGYIRELTMFFETKNGLQAGQDYQIVFNGKATSQALKLGEYVNIFTMDDTDLKPYEAIERGVAKLTEAPQDAAYGAEGVKFLIPDGFKIVRGAGTNLYELSDGVSLYAELRGDVNGGGIKASSVLRMFLWPLTQWDVATACSATCIPFDEVTKPCGTIQSCMAEPVLTNFQTNTLVIVLPAGMAQATTEVYQTVAVHSLQLPPGGFFPGKIGAEISVSDDTKPHYTTSVGDLLYKMPNEGEAIGRLVEYHGDGDSRPFRGEMGNVIYAQVILAATLYSAVANGDALFTLSLPPGYQCLRPSDINGKSPWEAPDDLGVFEGKIPQGRGTADDGSGTRGWSVIENNCTYTLPQNGVLYAGSSLYFRVTVNNPSLALSRLNTSNRWRTISKSKGLHQQLFVEMPAEGFATTGTNYGDNVAVLGKIEHASLVPFNFAKSTTSDIFQQGLLQIFFKTDQYNGVGGFVRLTAPDGFSFDPCLASDLDDHYYAKYYKSTGYNLFRLPGIVSCFYYTTPYNRVEVGLEGALLSDHYYGFKINARNAINFDQAQLLGWTLTTLTKEMYGIDGTPDTLRLAHPSITNESYGIYAEPLNGLSVMLSSLRPFMLSQKPAVATVRLEVPTTITSNLRIVAPEGYMWDITGSNFRHRPLGVGADKNLMLACITSAFPGGLPHIAGNVLKWAANATYDRTATYGFAAPIKVPPTSPTSVSAFIFEFGYDAINIADRFGAATVNFIESRHTSFTEAVSSSCTGTSCTQQVFQVEIAATVPAGGILRLVGPLAFGLPQDCTSQLQQSSDANSGCTLFQLPAGTTCAYQIINLESHIVLTLAEEMPVGVYRLALTFNAGYSLRSQNTVDVTSVCGFKDCWKYVTSGSIGEIDNRNLDWRTPEEVGGSIIRALSDPAVEYMTNVESKANNITFQVRIVTYVREHGGIFIAGPDGYQIPESCAILAAPAERGSPYFLTANSGRVMTLPSDVICNAKSPIGYPVNITITAGASGIAPGFYRFAIAVTNPSTVRMKVEDVASSCGYRDCWVFNTVQKVAGMAPLASPPTIKLDASTTVASFPINKLMVEGVMPSLTPAQRTATLRDDRPLMLNPLVLAFKLSSTIRFSTIMTIKAPIGFVFREECLSDIEWRGFMVFGNAPALPTGYTDWPADVSIISCRGVGPDAELGIDVGASDGLLAEQLYPIRVDILHNPQVDPAWNKWQISVATESSNPFDGFLLWKFSRLSTATVSTARSDSVTGAVKLRNPVTITFRPHNTVLHPLKKIIVTAPPSFEIARDSSNMCEIIMQPLLHVPATTGAPPMNFTAPRSAQWNQADAACTVDSTNLREMTIEVKADNRDLYNDIDYQLTVYVYNPMLIPEVPDYVWKLQTEASPVDYMPLYRDLSVFDGYAVNERIHTFVVRNEDPRTGIAYLNGKTRVVEMFIELRFNLKLEKDDVIQVQAPAGFMLVANPAATGAAASAIGASCDNFKWEPVDGDYLTSASTIFCAVSTMVLTYREEKEWPELKPLKWRMDTINVAKTPHVMLNHWECSLYSKIGAIRASGAVLGWDIRPQLENIQITVNGDEIAAGAKSAMTISFFPIQDADELTLTAELPAGFDFTGAVSDIVGQEVISTSVELVRVRVSIYAEQQTTCRLSNFRLGQIGGPTQFDLVTKLNDGTQMDEKYDFLGGFRLAGKLTVTDKKLNSAYQQDPATYPIPALWGTRVQEPALATFIFRLTRQANIGTKLHLAIAHSISTTNPYMFQAGSFLLQQVSPEVTVATTIDPGYGTHMDITVNGYLWVNTDYRVRVLVTTPTLLNADESMWRIEVRDDKGAAEPVNTNDGLTTGFPLVKQMPFQILAGKSPPMAQVPVEVQVDPVGTNPTELLVVAPPGFNFTESCLVEGGTGDVVTACQRTAPVAGREAAILTCKAGGLQTLTEFVRVMVVAPAANAVPPNWFVQARDSVLNKELAWGEDTVGLQIRQMSGSAVAFPGIPGVAGQMAFKFETNLKVEANGKLRVGYPKDLTVSCAGEFLHKVGLQGDVRCTNFPREGFFELYLPRPLPPGRQGFAVTSTAPNAINDPNGNIFYIQVWNPIAEGGNVVDAAMSIPGMGIQHGLMLRYLPLIWGSSEPNRAASVSLGFELLADMPEVNPPVMSEILIRVPLDFYQLVQRPSQVELEGNLPLRQSTWLDFSVPQQIKIYLDEAVTPTLPPGSFRVQFPVWVPGRMPRNNMWMITVCKPASVNATTCNDEFDARALVTFPVAGFELNEVHPSTAEDGKGAASIARRSSRCWLVALVLFASIAGDWYHWLCKN